MQGVLAVGHKLKEGGSFIIREKNPWVQSLADPPGVVHIEQGLPCPYK